MMLLLIILVAVGCQDAPYFHIGTCNVTCNACTSKQMYNFCLSCQAGLALVETSGVCTVLPTEQVYFGEYFTDLLLVNKTDKYAGWYVYNITTTHELNDAEVKGCYNSVLANYFNFDVIGMFNSTWTIQRQFGYDYQLESAVLMFRGLFFVTPITFTSTVNGQQVMNQTIPGGFNFATNQYLGKLDCRVFTYQTSQIFYRKFITDRFQLDSDKVFLQISAEYSISTANGTAEGKWGVRQIVLVLRKCTNCVSPETVSLARNLGIIFGSLLGCLVFLMLPILVLDSLQQKQILQKHRFSTQNNSQRLSKMKSRSVSYRSSRAMQQRLSELRT